jgi:hypothetical protein
MQEQEDRDRTRWEQVTDNLDLLFEKVKRFSTNQDQDHVPFWWGGAWRQWWGMYSLKAFSGASATPRRIPELKKTPSPVSPSRVTRAEASADSLHAAAASCLRPPRLPSSPGLLASGKGSGAPSL